MVQKKAKIIASEFFFVETYIIHYLEAIIRKWGSLYIHIGFIQSFLVFKNTLYKFVGWGKNNMVVESSMHSKSRLKD